MYEIEFNQRRQKGWHTRSPEELPRIQFGQAIHEVTRDKAATIPSWYKRLMAHQLRVSSFESAASSSQRIQHRLPPIRVGIARRWSRPGS